MRSALAVDREEAPARAPLHDLTRRNLSSRLLAVLEVWGVLIVFALLFGMFSILSPDLFLTWGNILTILDQTSIVILLAVGLTFVLAAGEFDLSFPYLFGLVSGVTVAAMTKGHVAVPLAVVLGLAAGAAGGAINGAIVATKRASSFIVTLAMGSVYTGIMIWIAGPSPIAEGIPAGFGRIAFHIGDFSADMLAAVVVALLGGIALRFTVFGRYVQATGSNPEAAAIAGINLRFIRIGAFVVLGLCVAIASILQAAISSAHYPDAGTSLFLPPFVAAFIGTSVLARGRFNVFGTFVGAIFVSTLATGLVVQNVSQWVISLLQGGVLLGAVLVTRARGRVL